MPNFRTTITPTTPTDPNKPTVQLFSPTLERAKVELEEWKKKLGPGKYRIVEVMEVVREEGEC